MLALSNLQQTLAEAGSSMAEVVKFNVYLVAAGPEDMRRATIAVASAMHKVCKQCQLPRDQRAAATWVGVTALIDTRHMVEIEAIATTAKPVRSKL